MAVDIMADSFDGFEPSASPDQGVPRFHGGKIRTLFCTSGGVLGAIVLAKLVADPDFEVVGLVKSVRVFRADMGFLRGAANFFTRCGILYTVYIWFVTTALEVIGLILGQERASVGVIARRRGIPVFATRDLNSPEGRGFLQSIQPDLLIAAHFDQKLDPDLCDGVGYAAVNVHPSLLPLHRGVEPVLQSLLAEEGMIGVTLHRLSEQIDRGRILESHSLRRDPRWSVFAASVHLMVAGADLVLLKKRFLLEVGSGAPQSEEGSYESWPQPKEVYRLYRQRMALIRLRDLFLF